MKRILSFATVLLLSADFCSGQKLALSTNFIDYMDLGTLNLQVAYGAARNWSLDFMARYNPFTYHEGKEGRQLQKRQQAYTLGFRWWPWHLWSGWWAGSGIKYQEYNIGGILSRQTEEGDRVGISLSAGYSLMLHPHVNLDFGLGFWSGWSRFTSYSCPSCGRVEKSGQRIFLLPDNVMLSVVYVF